MVIQNGNPSLRPADPLASLDRINTAIIQGSDLDVMMENVLDAMLDIFQCDRAWFLYPCDPNADQVLVRCERCRPNWPGVRADGGVICSNPKTSQFLEMCLRSDGVLRFDPAENPVDHENDAVLARFEVQSLMAMPLAPSNGPNWVLGLHHCERPVVYDLAAPLFGAIGNRIADGLTTAIAFEDLRESEARLRALVDHSPDAIVVVDVETGLYVDANPAAARMYGIALADFTNGFGPLDLVEEFQPDGEASIQKISNCISEAMAGVTPKFECTHKRFDGTVFPVEVSLAHYPDPHRQMVCGTIKDLTTRRQAETQRLDLEKQLALSQRLETVGQMTGGVAHDFNNLLGVILGNLELTLAETEQSEAATEFIQNSIEATQKGAKLSKNMLSFARRAQLSPTTLYLNRIVRGISEWSGRTIPAAIDLRLSLAAGLWPVSADRAATESAILNLIINGRDAMNGQGQLTLETSNLTVNGPQNHKINDEDTELVPGDYVVLSISDTGTGIPKENIARVIDPFFTTKLPGQGSGLGLSMVHGFMKQSGGAVHITSEVRVGTSVKLFFPALTARDTEGATPIKPHVSRKIVPARILVAEDQPEVMNIVLRILRAAGHDAYGATSGDVALEVFYTEGPFDVLLTDIVMPGALQGPKLAEALRAKDPSLPVVFMTGYAGEAAVHGNGLRAADIRLTKPVSRGKLLAAIGSVLRKT